MATLDAGLRFLLAQSSSVLDEIAESQREMIARPRAKRARGARAGKAAKVDTRVRVLAQYAGEAKALSAAGMEITSVAGDVVAGFVSLAKLDAVAAIPGLLVLEQSRPMRRELDVSMPATRANLVHTGPPGLRGAGVIVGVIDSGVDWRHQSFRRADGTSRILRIWDQSLAPVTGESSPAGFTFGVEYNKAQIDANLVSATPPVPVRHVDNDSGGHGSHVTGIAAGDGSVAGNGQPAFTFVGMAPEADIVMVANTIGGSALGDSANTLDAATYIFGFAASLGRACVINLSQGDYIGPHDGTSLLERGIDTLLGTARRAMVKSAGNSAQDAAHATGVVPASGTLDLPMSVMSGDTSDDTVDIWYEGPDRFRLSVVPPGGVASAVVNPASTTTLALPNGNRVFVDSTLNNPFNADNRIFVRLQRGTAAAIQAGTWRLRLHGQVVSNGRAHAWIQRGNGPIFLAPVVSIDSTISIPGTGTRIITVGSYVTKGAGVASLSTFSSRGPTRDGRTKPEISAPGQAIMSVRNGGSGTDQYVSMSGTSMAAPHVTGAVALMLQRRSTATIAQIRSCLTSNAVKDAFTGTTTNNDWGFGKLDATAANDCIGTLRWASIGGVLTSDPTATLNQPGGLVVFARGTDNAIWHTWQDQLDGDWAPWTSLGGNWTSGPGAALYRDGRLNVFARGTDNAIWTIWQTTPNGDWSGWASIGGVLTSDPTATLNQPGGLVVFARGTDNAIWHTWQDQLDGDWAPWTSLGGNWTSGPGAALYRDGRLNVFARGTDNAIWTIWQTTPNGDWSGWASIGGVLTSDPTATLNQPGGLVVFARGTDNAIWHTWQDQLDGDWAPWTSLSGNWTSGPGAALYRDGRLNVFARGTDNAIWTIWQTTPNGDWFH